MELADGGEVDTIMGGLTDEDEDVIPYGRFESETYNRNKWTAVGDFYPETDPHPDGAHAAVFLRVLNRTWGGSPDQTRIGSFVYGGLWTAGACNNEYCGALQLQGDDVTADPEGSEGLQELIEFDLDEFPWGSSSHLYRVQVMEEERLHTLRWTWEHWWRAEAHDLTDDSGPPNYDPAGRIGYSSWIGEWTLEIIFGIEEPNLTNSKLAFGLGPSRSPFTGKVRFERVATNAWDY